MCYFRKLLVLITTVIVFLFANFTSVHSKNSENENFESEKIASFLLAANSNEKYKLQCPLAYSADTVFLSDPLFFMNFITNRKNTLDYFYSMAIRRGIDASMFVTAEPVIDDILSLSTSQMPAEKYSIFKTYKPLSVRKIKTTLRAKNVVTSPLMHLFAPKLVSDIHTYRQQCNLSPMQTLNSYYIPTKKNSMAIRYNHALQKLAHLIATYMKEQSVNNITFVLDSPHAQNTRNITTVLQILYDEIPTIQTKFLQNERSPSTRDITSKQIHAIDTNAVIVLYAGAHTILASQELHNQNPMNTHRTFAILDWEPLPYKTKNTTSYAINATAWVAIPLSAIFENNNYINARLYRFIQ